MANDVDLNNVSIVVPSSDYNLWEDKRYLIPFTSNGKFGMMTHNCKEVIAPNYDVIQNNCMSLSDLIIVGNHHTYAYNRQYGSPAIYHDMRYGIIDSNGNTVIPIKIRKHITNILVMSYLMPQNSIAIPRTNYHIF